MLVVALKIMVKSDWANFTFVFACTCFHEDIHVPVMKFKICNLFQFEAYSLEKVGKNVKEAAKLLEEM